MRLPFRLASLAVAGFAIALGGCQGSLGSGPGLQLPATASNAQPAGPGVAGVQSRQRALAGAVYLTPDMTTLPLPPLDGFAVALQLGTPPPSSSPSPEPTASGSPRATSSHRRAALHRTKTRSVAVAVAAPSALQTGATTAAPSAPPAPSVTPAAGPSGPAPSPTGSAVGSKMVTKLIVYPDDAPSAPTPQPSGNVQTFPTRKALVRGFIKPGADIALYGLGAVKFTIPAQEDVAQRGYTVAVFSAGRRHHDSLIASDSTAAVIAHVVASAAVDGLVLKKNTDYLLVLYADELAATPGPVPSGYPSPGINPFVTPQPGVSAVTGPAVPGAYGGATSAPSAASTYFH